MRSMLFLVMLFITSVAVFSQAAAHAMDSIQQAAATSKAVDEQKDSQEGSGDEGAEEEAAGEVDEEKRDVEENAASQEEDDSEEAEAEKSADKESDAKEVKLRCHFVSKREERTILRPLEWKSFPIKSVVEHGAEVQRGDTVISFDSRQLDAAIEDLENEIAQAKISVEQAENSLDVLQRSNELAMEAAERANESPLRI